MQIINSEQVNTYIVDLEQLLSQLHNLSLDDSDAIKQWNAKMVKACSKAAGLIRDPVSSPNNYQLEARGDINSQLTKRRVGNVEKYIQSLVDQLKEIKKIKLKPLS